MDDLIAGYRRFRAAGWPERRQIFESLAEDRAKSLHPGGGLRG